MQDAGALTIPRYTEVLFVIELGVRLRQDGLRQILRKVLLLWLT